MFLSSPAFRNGEPIPRKFSREGQDVSPALKWSDVPQGAAELVLICEDPDAPQQEPWVHWIAYGISPSSINGLPEGLPKDSNLEHPVSAKQGMNSYGQLGYGGPMPPVGHGRHRYFFRVFALSSPTELAPGARKDEVLEAIQGRILAEAQIIGVYERKRAAA